ncbi:hypothetical protein KIH86_24390 [Paenibacillus sp. HN-1]|uniref:hypothetical protein n=2 Tax=Paenibacillus TaxID=44249 RepID=UPI001CA7BA0B|nr:hypothetical protein [Paenibacillus sp. CGMCC 1.18879]MBY9079164.1 hypothetical protein [Paenibacillus sp. CGMCC 1.18879]MBY9087327.1 hypothetical protein [Paenibacillus sinensis]
MPSNPRLEMTEQQLYLVSQAMKEMDAHFDREGYMVCEEVKGEWCHATRESAHYALGLLLRDEGKDAETAVKVIDRVLDMQLTADGEIYDGTFVQSPQRPRPPAGYTAWGVFPPGYGYANPDAMDEVYRRFAEYAGLKEPELFELFRRAADEVYPRVWRSFDPNWREFIACTFALILEHFEEKLPKEQVEEIDRAMQRTVSASLERFLSQSIPTNTNIELMHLFISHYYGHRYESLEWTVHAELGAMRLLQDYREFHSFAEFNSSTYYGVDLTVLGMWRRYSRTDSFKGIGQEMEHGLWEDIADFYEPNLENLCGPFARSYENEITEHSSIGVFLYLALGEDYRHLTGVNCETSHDPMIALVGTDVPEAVRMKLSASQGERSIFRRFKELCERDLPGHNRHVCAASAWITPALMIGGMSGSRNTNGQMHNATAHWLAGDGKRYTLRMVRRAVGETWNSHLRGMAFNAEASERRLDIAAEFHSETPVELVFEIGGEDVSGVEIAPGRWNLPGLTVSVEADAPEPVLLHTGTKAEIVYPVHTGERVWEKMRFVLRFEG